MTGYPYYSPPPPPPQPPKCNHTIPPSPPPPPPPKPPCNHTVPPPPPPPTKCNHTLPPLPPPAPPPCYCVCPPTVPPASPPHYNSTPPAPGPDSPPDNTVYIAVFVSLGGVFFLAFLAVGLFCLAKKKKKMIPPPAAAAACVEEHQHIQETITTGPCGEQTVTLTIDDDVRIHEATEVGATVCSQPEPPDCGAASVSPAEGHLKTG